MKTLRSAQEATVTHGSSLFPLSSILIRIIAAAFFTFSCAAFLADFQSTGRLTSLGWMISEALVVALFVLRRSSNLVSRKPGDWLAAAGGSFVFLLARPTGSMLVVPMIAVIIQIVGVFIQGYSKIALGRSFGVVAANRGIKVSGPYQYVRHPMYAGYLVAHIGFLLANLSSWNLAVYAVGYTMQIYRIKAEESYLMPDAKYQTYCNQVRYRLVPGLF